MSLRILSPEEANKHRKEKNIEMSDWWAGLDEYWKNKIYSSFKDISTISTCNHDWLPVNDYQMYYCKDCEITFTKSEFRKHKLRQIEK